MIKEIMHDPIFLGIKSEMATKEDLQAAQDLLTSHRLVRGCFLFVYLP